MCDDMVRKEEPWTALDEVFGSPCCVFARSLGVMSTSQGVGIFRDLVGQYLTLRTLERSWDLSNMSGESVLEPRARRGLRCP